MRPALTILLLWAALPASAQTVDVGDKFSFIRSIHIAENEVAGEAICIGCSIRVDGALTGEAIAVGGNVTVNGTIEGEVIVAGGDVTLGPGAQVGGEIVAVGGYFARDSTATVAGEVEVAMSFVHTPGQRALHWPGGLLLLGVNWVVALFGGGVLKRPRLEGLAGALGRHRLLTPLIGVGALALTIVLGLTTEYLGRFEDWGDWLFLILLLGGSLIGVVGVAFLAGRLMVGDGPVWRVMVTGAATVTLIQLMPVVGFFFVAVLFVLGFGLSVVSGMGSSPDWLIERLARSRS